MESESGSEHGMAENTRVTVDNVLEALENIKDMHGSTVAALKKYIVSNSPVKLNDKDVSLQIKQAIKRGIQDGCIAKFTHRKFALGGVGDEEEGSKKGRRRRRADDDDEMKGRRRRGRIKGRRPMRRRRSRRRGRRRSRRRKGRSRRRRRRSRRRGKKRSRRRRGRY